MSELWKELIARGGGVVAASRGRKLVIGDGSVLPNLGGGDGFVDIKTATPELCEQTMKAIEEAA